MKTTTPARKEQGFSLVELMVAMVVGLLLLAGVLQILLGNRESFEAQRALADVQEQGRLASFFMENVVAHAGHRVNLVAPGRFVFPAETVDGFALGGGAVVAAENNDANGNDAVHVRFQSDGNFTNCDGSQVDDIGDFSLAVSDDGELTCNAEPLTEEDSVARFNIRYGLDTDDDDAVDAYVDELNNADTQQQVRSLRLQLLLRSRENVLPQGLARPFDFADGTTFTTPGNDRRAYEFIDQTIALRNLLP